MRFPFLNKSIQASSEIASLEKQLTEASQKIAAIQSSISIAADDTTTYHYTLNKYNSYTKKIVQLSKMMNGKAQWGGGTLQMIAASRAAFIIGPGLRVSLDPKYPNAGKELDFAKQFIKYNNLNEHTALQWGKSAELYGKFLALLKPDPSYTQKPFTGMIKLIPKPYDAYNYKIDYDPDDLSHYTRASYTSATKKTGFDVGESGFIYSVFGGQLSDVNEPIPPIGAAIDDIENLDKAAFDWRKANHLYAAPTPWFNFASAAEARKFYESNQYKNWRIGKGIVTTGCDFSIIGLQGQGYTTIKDEMQYLARRISGVTGIPVHFFGFPDLLSNRDTADNMIEGVIMATNRERQGWASWYDDAIKKAMQLYNLKFNGSLDPDAIMTTIVVTSSSQMTNIKDVWLPAYHAGAISLHTLLMQLSVSDIKNERKEIEKDASLRTSNAIKLEQGQNPANSRSGYSG